MPLLRVDPRPVARLPATGPLATEHEEQCAVIDWARWHERLEPRLALLHAIPNAGAGAQKGQAGKMKAEGVKPGVPDLCLPAPTADWFGLYIELKRRKGGRVRPDQRWWIDALRSNQYAVHVCAGADEAIRVLKDYLQMGRA